jgi:hypothetical protein
MEEEQHIAVEDLQEDGDIVPLYSLILDMIKYLVKEMKLTGSGLETGILN